MTAGPVKSSNKRVSFDELNIAIVHHIDALDACQSQELFYHQDDYDRFRYERNLEIERSIRKQLQSFRRATRRSSIELVSPSGEALPPTSLLPPTTPHPVDNIITPPQHHTIMPVQQTMMRQPPPRTRHNTPIWRKSPVPRPFPGRSSTAPGVALAA